MPETSIFSIINCSYTHLPWIYNKSPLQKCAGFRLWTSTHIFGNKSHGNQWDGTGNKDIQNYTHISLSNQVKDMNLLKC